LPQLSEIPLSFFLDSQLRFSSELDDVQPGFSAKLYAWSFAVPRKKMVMKKHFLKLEAIQT